MVTGNDKNFKIQQEEFCEQFVQGKMTRIPFGTGTRSERFLEIVQSDICGDIRPETYDHNRHCHIY